MMPVAVDLLPSCLPPCVAVVASMAGLGWQCQEARYRQGKARARRGQILAAKRRV